MIYKNGERVRDFLGLFISYCSLVFYILGAFFNKTIIPLALVGYEMIIANSALRASLAIYLRIGSCLACVYRVMDARGKFGEHERSVRVARGAAESNSSFLSALQTSQVHP